MSQDFQIAKALHAEGRLEEASLAYRRVGDDDEDHYRALNNLGLVLEAQGRLQEAANVLEQAVAARGDSPITQYNRARMLHRLGHLMEAISGYRRASELDPDWADPHHNLAMAQQQVGELEEAEASYRRTLALEPENLSAHSHLGDLLFDARRAQAALTHYRHAVEIDPREARLHFDVAKTLAALGSYEEAITAYRHCIEIEPRSGPAYQNLADVLRRTGRFVDAKAVLETWLALAGEDPVPRHLLAALTGEGVPERVGNDAVRELFDEFADSFDATLAKLDYQAPRLVIAAIAEVYSRADAAYRILDAGCGTGLCGPLFRSRAERLVGVDLSPRMLDKARERKVYDELVESDLTDFLQSHPGGYDIIASADTLNYFGDLDAVLRAAGRALGKGGHLVFTLERAAGSNEQPWRLEPNGRYSHSEPYLRAALTKAGMRVVTLCSGILRKEGVDTVEGWIVTAVSPEPR